MAAQAEPRGNGTLELWTRHFLDSFQLFELRRNPMTSGSTSDRAAVFPGWSARSARTGRSQPDFRAGGKRHAEMRVPAGGCAANGVSVISATREDRSASSARRDIVSARALAPLPRLLEWVHRHMRPMVSVCCKRARAMAWSLKPRAPTGRWMSTSCRR
jgi:16S rRNA (guanine527-N7)-methyltransferase